MPPGLQFSAQVVHDYVSSSYSGGTTLVCMLIMLLMRALQYIGGSYPQQQSSDSAELALLTELKSEGTREIIKFLIVRII